jgi:hypothetical protein
LIQFVNNPAQFDNFRPGADNGQYLESHTLPAFPF